MFCIYLRTNSDLCHLQHKLIGFDIVEIARVLDMFPKLFPSWLTQRLLSIPVTERKVLCIKVRSLLSYANYETYFDAALSCAITKKLQATVCEVYLCAMKNEVHVSVTAPLNLLKLCGEYWSKLDCMPAT